MKGKRCNETPRGFQEEEGPCTSYSKRGEGKRHEGHLEPKILRRYLVEYKSQPRYFKETLALPQFIQMEEERRPYNNVMMRGNRFPLSTFDGSPTCAAKAWVMKLEVFFLLHPVAEREAVEIAAMYLEGEARTWWFSHVIHARVSNFSDFTQKVIKRFDKEKSKEEKPSPPWEEAYTSAIITMEEQPSSSAVGEANTWEEETLVAMQETSKCHKGMPKFPSLII